MAGRNIWLTIQDTHGNLFADVYLPKPIYDAMVSNAIQTGIPLGDWVKDAIKQSLDAIPTRPSVVNALCENESAIMASNATMLMLFDRIELSASGAEVHNSPEYIGGLVHLIHSVQDRLTAAHAGVQAISFPKREVAK